MAEVERADAFRVDKPWGYELRWATTPRYAGKILHINAGEALSLQYHEVKEESLLVLSGELDFELEANEGALRNHRLRPGDCIHVLPHHRHRMTAVTDCDLVEVSSPELEDIVRLEDRYGRGGTASAS